MEVCLVLAGAFGIASCFFASGLVVDKLQEYGASGTLVEEDVWGNFQTASIKVDSIEGVVRVVAFYDRVEH